RLASCGAGVRIDVVRGEVARVVINGLVVVTGARLGWHAAAGFGPGAWAGRGSRPQLAKRPAGAAAQKYENGDEKEDQEEDGQASQKSGQLSRGPGLLCRRVRGGVRGRLRLGEECRCLRHCRGLYGWGETRAAQRQP